MQDIVALPASVKHVDGLNCVNPSVSEKVRMGQEAMARKRRGWADWIAIGEALHIGRTDVMRDIHTNQPAGRRYEKAMAEWLVANGFKEIDKGVRSRLLECLQHRAEIDQWLSRLTDSERFRLNHPNAVLKRWRGSTIVPDPNAAAKPPSAFAKLKEANVELQERLHRAERKIDAGGGDLWTSKDRPDDIASAMLAHLSLDKAESVARAILRKIKEQHAPESRSWACAETSSFDANFNLTLQSIGAQA